MERPAKRPRLSMACNICRQRKVKCDAEYPKCRNCRVRNQTCVTTDPQRPGCPGVREWLEIPDKQSQCTLGAGQNGDHLPGQRTPTPRIAIEPTMPEETAAEASPDNEESPVRQPFDTSVNTELGTKRTKILGGSSSQCLAKSLDVYFQAARMQPVSGFFRHGMRHAEELDLALALMLPELPDADKRARYLSVYRSRIHPLYPIYDLNRMEAGIAQLATISSFKSLPRDDIPLLVGAYLVLSIGADEFAQCPTEEGECYLHAAASLLAHIIVVPYQHTVQALLHFTIAYRGHNQEGLAWQTLGMAIRIAYTLGLHRPPPSKAVPDAPGKHDFHTQVWATCCSLEKVMHLASGWPTLIPDDLMARPDSLNGTQHRFLQWHLGLAEFQGNISHHLYSYRPSCSGKKTNPRSVRQILLDTARLDRALLSWANEIPAELRPGNDIICANDDFHIVTFLSLEYHAAMIALHRAALIAPRSKIEEEVMKYCPDDPSRFRLANGESVCVNSARAIAKLSIDLQDRRLDSCLIPSGTAMLACIALAVYLMKHPRSRLQAMDMQLLKACLAYSSTRMAQSNIDPRFIEGLARIYDQIQARLDTNSAAAKVDSMRSSPLKRLDGQASSQSAGKQSTSTSSHSLGHLLTPSTYETCPMPPQPPNGDGTVVNGNGSIHAAAPQRAQSVPQPVPDPLRHGMAIHNGWPPADQNMAMSEIALDNPYSSNMFVDGGVPSDFDQAFPFEGLNVEELWNWMSYFDSPRSTDTV
ncbi:uncharacterized protein BJX67DRAFT_387602 [Aspergillus lucknowensis]|uniref:Zn(2)-C6 fungal-type domain-containing protein n=1 Tax=Aspergillus lucknowensis TaxID=176173 RepID=A0ABR4LSZ8_9EURO